MKIEMIGHASIFVTTQSAKFLIDPVLWDPHQEGLFDVCPKREVITEKIPEFDILIISHQHLDHFDIRSLAFLPKDVEVIIPKDPLIEKCLRKLGYQKIYPLKDFRELKIGSTNLMTTRSENRVPEFGIILQDESGTFWNCVDTVLSPDTIAYVLEQYPKIDFLLATWQPMLESNYQNHDSLSFPYLEYGQLLYNINLINPQALSPGANGFKYIDGGSWLNQIVFPVTYEQFCQDAKKACPELKENVFSLEPGDTVEFNNGDFNYSVESCEFVIKIADHREQIDFSPVNVGNNMVDLNLNKYDVDLMRQEIDIEIAKLADFMTENMDSLFKEYSRWNVIYQLEIIFPHGSIKYFFDFTKEKIEAQPGRNPVANLFTYVTASSFYSLLQRTKGIDYLTLGGYYRTFKKIYHVTPRGLIPPHYINFAEPLIHYLSQDNLESLMRDLEIETWKKNTVEYSTNGSKKTQNKVKIEAKDAETWFSSPRRFQLPV